MNAGALFAILFFGGLIGGIALLGIRSKKRKQQGLSLAASVMTGPIVEKARVYGRVHGRLVTFALGSRGSGRNQTSWTEIYVELPVDVVLNLRRQTAYQEKLVRQGLAIDLQLGDPAFDAAFIVEVAPAVIAHDVFTPDIRARLLSFHPHEVATEGRYLHLAKQGWLTQPGVVEEAVDVAGRLGASLEPALAKLKQAAISAASGVGYRGVADVDPTAGVMAGVAQEVAQLRDVAARRAVIVRRRAQIAAVLFVLAAVGLAVARVMLRTHR